MNRTTAVIAAGIVGLAIAATGCSSNKPPIDKPAASAPPAAASSSPAAAHYDSAQAIVDKIKAAGLAATTPKKSTDDSYISEVGGQDYELVISQKPGQTIGGSGIDLFPNSKALAGWTAVSQGMGGIAVVGDTWAVSLPSSSDDRTITNAMAPVIAKALGGTVAR